MRGPLSLAKPRPDFRAGLFAGAGWAAGEDESGVGGRRRLAEHLETVAEHLETVAEHLETVAEHLETVAEVPKMLAEVPEVLAEVREMLAEPVLARVAWGKPKAWATRTGAGSKGLCS